MSKTIYLILERNGSILFVPSPTLPFLTLPLAHKTPDPATYSLIHTMQRSDATGEYADHYYLAHGVGTDTPKNGCWITIFDDSTPIHQYVLQAIECIKHGELYSYYEEEIPA